jgi:hypothetical protein
MRSAGPSPSTITPRTITNGGFTASLGAGCSGCSGPTSSVLEWSSGSLRRGPHRGGPHGRATECFLPAVDLDSKEAPRLWQWSERVVTSNCPRSCLRGPFEVPRLAAVR